MTADFDPYYRWLGIPPAEQPANHYRLLGLALFESSPEVIQEAADRQMAHVKTHKNGPQREVSQRLLNELSAARVCLLRPADRAAYDAQLRARQYQINPAGSSPPARAASVAPAEAEIPLPRRTGLWIAAVGGGVLAGLLILLGISFFSGGRPIAEQTPPDNLDEVDPDDAAPVEPPPIEAPGLVAEVYEGAEFQRLAETRIDPQVNFFWGSGAAGEGLPADDFSVRWTGWLRPPAAGHYQLTLIADEPARLWLGEQPLLAGGEAARQAQSAGLDLEDRPYAVKIEFQDTRGGAWISFRWQSPGEAEQAVPTWALFQDQAAATAGRVAEAAAKLSALRKAPPVEGRLPGLAAELFTDKDFENLLVRRVDPTLDFYWLRGMPIVAPPSEPPPEDAAEEDPAEEQPSKNSGHPLPETLYARWRGWLTPPAAGTFTLIVGVDDGARVWIDRKLQLDAWRVGEPKRFEVPVKLSARRHELRVDYFKQSADGLLTLHWIPPDSGEQVIPAEFLSHDE